MAEELPYPSEDFKFSRRKFLSTAVSITMAGLVPNVAPSKAKTSTAHPSRDHDHAC
jgi:hypothetical protein